jgi:hypothetical protein
MAESAMKSVLVQLANAAAARGLPFLLVGGNAMILWGVPRFTRDIDLLVTDAYRAEWHHLIMQLGYRLLHKVDAFEQFECPGRPGIDIMLVNADTWEKLLVAAQEVELDQEATALIPAVLHLIAMKLNAAKNPHRRADATDLQDVMALIRTLQIDTSSEEFVAILDRYASADDKTAIHAMLNRS